MERRNRNILVIMIAVVIAAAVFSSFGLPLFANPTPSIVLPTPSPSGSALPGAAEQEAGTRVEVTPGTVQSVIAALSRLESYSRRVTTTLEGSSSTAQVWVDQGWTRSDLSLPTGLEIHTIVGDGRVWRWYGREGTVASWAADDASMDIDSQRIPTYEDVLALDPAWITAAGYEEKNGEACVYVEVAIPEPEQVERYWVSADNGLLTAAETESQGAVVWSMTAGQPELSVDSAEPFTLPDGTGLHSVEAE